MALYENFPYTNFHEMNLDWVIKTVKKVVEEWDNLSGDIQATAVESDTASVTVTGSLQEGLTFNFGLPRGEAGENGEDGVGIQSAVVSPSGVLTLIYSDGTSYDSPSLIGPAGPQGPVGNGINIKATLASVSDLPASATPGDAYLVGTTAPYNLYVWASGTNSWIDNGPMSTPSPSSSTPLMDGTATAGTDPEYSRGDHVHPHDSSKQDALVSGTNIKTINGTSLLGSGNVAVQPTLVSGTNIKTINNGSVLGTGNISLQATLVSGTNIKTVNGTSLLGSGNVAVQPTLVSGTNIATVNGSNMLDGGNVRTVHTYYGTADPNDSDPTGSADGDIYIQIGA